MSDTATQDTRARLRETLDRFQDGDTLVLAVHHKGYVVTHTVGGDPDCLIDTARLLLDEALESLEHAPTPGNRLLRRSVSNALEELPEPRSSADEGDAP